MTNELNFNGQTLTELLLWRYHNEPEKTACHYVDAEENSVPVTVRELIEKSLAYAQVYGEAKVERKIITVCLYHSLDLHAAFIGGLLAGHIPTMIAPPSPRMEPKKYANSFVKMLEHIHSSFVVIDEQTKSKLAELNLNQFPYAEILIAESVGNSHSRLKPVVADPTGIAILQHSSGTTGLQKGVALSHEAIIAHNKSYAKKLNLSRGDTIVSWLPLYHDMGFVACFLMPLCHGIPLVEISPFDWVVNPHILLKKIHEHCGTRCWLPNFAFSFMAESVAESHVQSDLNLSSVKTWVNCSEPVLDHSHEKFLKRFEQYGVTRKQFTASYAMAENVYGVTQSLPEEYRIFKADKKIFTDEQRAIETDLADCFTFVSNGAAIDGVTVKIIDENDNFLAEGQVGEIAIKGLFPFSGYYQQPDLTLKAMLTGGWYKTGDMGFLLHNELYVTGRKKDLLIIKGRNFYPTDIEEETARVEGIVKGRVAAFTVTDVEIGTERLVIVAEADEKFQSHSQKLAMEIRKQVAQNLDVTPWQVKIVPPKWLIKSTAGKIARSDNREKYFREFQKH